MLFTLQTYFLASLASWISVAYRAWKEKQNFFETCRCLYNNNIYSLVGLNLAILIFHFCCTFVVQRSMPSSTPEHPIAFQTSFEFLFDVLFQCTFFEMSDSSFGYVCFLFYLKYLISIVHIKIANISIQINPVKPHHHHHLLCIQFLLFFITLYITLETFSHGYPVYNGFFLYFSIQFLKLVCLSLFDIFNHMMVISDQINLGNSMEMIQTIKIAELSFKLPPTILSTILFFYELKRRKSEGIPVSFLGNLMELYRLITSLQRIRAWNRVKPILLSRLTKIDPSLLAEDDTCIVCRLKMTVNDSVQLPCHHCFHINCFERWIFQKPQCPICSADLSYLLKDIEKSLPKNEDNQ